MTLALRDGSWSLGDSGSVRWIRAGGASVEQLEALRTAHGLHPLAVEDVQNPRQRPKVEDYDDHLFFVIRIPRSTDPDDGWQQVGIWLLPDLVITASPQAVPELDAVQARLLKRAGGVQNASRLFHVILDALVDAWFPFMDELEQEVEDVEDAAMDRPDADNLRRIRDMKRSASRIRKLIAPMRAAVSDLEREPHVCIDESVQPYLRDVSDHTIRLSERLDHVREIALIAQESWNAALANQQNQVMKRLTVVAALLLVPGLLAGLGGMNFDGMPAWNYWAVTGSIIGFIVAGFGIAAWKRWL